MSPNLGNRVKKIRELHSYATESSAFLHLILDSLFHPRDLDIQRAITDGGKDRGVDAVYIEESDHDALIHLFQSKYHSQHNAPKKNFPSNEIDKIFSFYNDLIAMRIDMQSTCNPILWARVEDIRGIIDQKQVRLHIHFCSNGIKLGHALIKGIPSAADM